MVKIKESLLVAVASTIVSGCAMNGVPNPFPDIPDPVSKGVEKTFVGVPLLLALEGSRTILDDEWVLTSAHNELILDAVGNEYYIHPTCDIALVRRNNPMPDYELGIVNLKEPLTHVGYPINMPLSASDGIFHRDLIAGDYPECQVSMSSASLVSGMSGGGVFNDRWELVGINQGVYMFTDITFEDEVYKSPSVFVSLLAVIDWIEAVTGKKYHLNRLERD